MLRKFFSEPLLHFTLIGIALFVLYQGVSPDSGDERRIVVTSDTIAVLAQRFAAVWTRPPTDDELQTLVDTHIRDEILYREGVAMGLDRNDTVIQRRVLQKLAVLGEETSTLSPPGDAELAEYFQRNAARYATPPVLSLQQVMLDPSRHGATLQTSLAALMGQLQAGADAETLGDPSLLPATLDSVPLDRLAQEFGRDFADAVLSLPVGDWTGPVRSGFGVHIVHVEKKIDAQAARLEDVRAAVERDWESDRRAAAGEAYYQSLLQGYDVQVEDQSAL